MAREDILIHENLHNFAPKLAMVETAAYDCLKDTILCTLREMFARHPEYTYVPDPERGFDFPDLDKTLISIWQNYPYETLFLPCITIGIGSQKYNPVSFNQNLATVDYLYDDNGKIVRDDFGRAIPIYWEFAGAWDTSFSININVQAPIERDQIADYIMICFMHLYRDKLYTRGIHVKSVSTGGESEVEWNNQHIYKLSVNLDLYSEWTHRIPFPTEKIDDLKVCIGAPVDPNDPNYVQDCYDNDKPETAIETIRCETDAGYVITEEWQEYIALTFATDEYLELFQKRYGINSLSELAVADWLDILSAISSSARLGYLKVICDLEDEIRRIAAEADIDLGDMLEEDGVEDGFGYGYGYGCTSMGQIVQLLGYRRELKNTYNSTVIRYTIS